VGNTTYTAGVQSESYFPAGFNPYTAFKNFSSQGLVHTAGTTLVVPSSFVMKALTDRADKMRVEGVLQSRDENGTPQSFTINKGGVEVAAGGSFTVDSYYDLSVQSNSGVSGGTLSIGDAFTIGATNKPTVFTQLGGVVSTGTYYPNSGYGLVTIQNASRYDQSAGTLRTGNSISLTGASRYEQSGGTLEVNGAGDLTLSGGSRYVLAGGAATITDELIVSGAGDVYQQSGGVMSVSDIRGRSAGRLEVTGGVLNVGHRFDLAASATLDFGSGTATMSIANNAVADLALGTVSNVGNTTYTAGVQSESYFPAGFNPYTAFKSFSSQGLVHSTNTRIVVPSSYSGQAQRLVAQSVEVRGTLGIQAGGAITSSADVTVAGGRLTGGGTVSAVSVINSGVIAPGFSPGKLTMNSAFTQTAAGRLSLEVEGTSRGTTYDWVAVSGATTLGGSLYVSSTTHPRLPIGTTFDVLTSSAVTGTFSDFTDETYLGLRWSVVGGNTLRLTTSADGSGDFVLDVRSGIQTQADVGRPRIAAAKSVVKTGAGTLVFSASNTYQGQTTIR
jgi:autotransporter-associated beta strand protein